MAPVERPHMSAGMAPGPTRSAPGWCRVARPQKLPGWRRGQLSAPGWCQVARPHNECRDGARANPHATGMVAGCKTSECAGMAPRPAKTHRDGAGRSWGPLQYRVGAGWQPQPLNPIQPQALNTTPSNPKPCAKTLKLTIAQDSVGVLRCALLEAPRGMTFETESRKHAPPSILVRIQQSKKQQH